MLVDPGDKVVEEVPSPVTLVSISVVVGFEVCPTVVDIVVDCSPVDDTSVTGGKVVDGIISLLGIPVVNISGTPSTVVGVEVEKSAVAEYKTVVSCVCSSV